MIKPLHSHPLTSCFVLAFVFAWAVWLPMIACQLPSTLLWLAGIAPIGSGILVTWLVDGQVGLRALENVPAPSGNSDFQLPAEAGCASPAEG
jgi:hypothetical protein